MAIAHRASSKRSSNTRALARARREGQFASVCRDAHRFVRHISFRVLQILIRYSYRLPKSLHPMTQLGIGVAALNHDSAFQAAYEKGMKKTEYWIHALDDCIDLVAKLPALAARL